MKFLTFEPDYYANDNIIYDPEYELMDVSFTGVFFNRDTLNIFFDCISTEFVVLTFVVMVVCEDEADLELAENYARRLPRVGPGTNVRVPKVGALSSFKKEPKNNDSFYIYTSPNVKRETKDSKIDVYVLKFNFSQYLYMSAYLYSFLNKECVIFGDYERFKSIDNFTLKHIRSSIYKSTIEKLYLQKVSIFDKLANRQMKIAVSILVSAPSDNGNKFHIILPTWINCRNYDKAIKIVGNYQIDEINFDKDFGDSERYLCNDIIETSYSYFNKNSNIESPVEFVNIICFDKEKNVAILKFTRDEFDYIRDLLNNTLE